MMRHTLLLSLPVFLFSDFVFTVLPGIDLNASCNASVSASQCLYKDAVCDGSTLVCACPEDRYADTANKQSLYRIDLNVSCNASVSATQCLYKDAVCDGSTLVCACPMDRYADTTNKQCLYKNCQTLQIQANWALKNDTYTVQNSAGQSYRIYCQFYNGYGYTFLSKKTNVNVNISSLYDDKSHVIIRHKRLNGVQYTSEIAQLGNYASTPVSVQYSAYSGYQGPKNNHMTPYIFVGFIPKSMTYAGAVQGWKVNGEELKFNNCDGSPNSYIAFFNRSGQQYTDVVHTDSLMYKWYNNASAVAQPENLPDEFFANYHEVHQGGCGGYGEGSNVLGAVGMKFTLDCEVPAKVPGAEMTYQGTKIGHTCTYECLSGYQHTGGDLYRTCTGSGAWYGSIPVCRIAGVKIATSQNDVRFVNIEGNETISINIHLADTKSIAYMRLYINDTTENQATIIIGRSQVEVMLCNSEGCTYNRTTVPNNQSQLIEITVDNDYSLVGEKCVLQPNPTTTSVRLSGRFTKLALLSLTGEASFANVPQTISVPQFVNNSYEHIESINVMFPLTTPPIDQPNGSPPPTTPLDEYPGLTPVVPKYRYPLLNSQPTSGASDGRNSSSKEECLTDCYCPCGWVEERKNYTQNEIATIVAAIQERLKVDLKKLTSTVSKTPKDEHMLEYVGKKRKLNSMPDNRPLAKAVGVAGAIFLVLALATIFVVDIGNIIRDLKTLRDNLRQVFGCKEASPQQTTVAPSTSK